MSLLELLKFSLFTILLLCPLIHGSQNATEKCVNSCELSNSLLDSAINLLIKAKDTYRCIDCETKPSQPQDCSEILNAGLNKSGIYTVFPRNRVLNGRPIKVYCDMETDGGGWTVIQRRGDFQRPVDYFYKDWQSYKKGFGDLDEDFWLGNDIIYAISNQKKYSARFDLRAVDGSSRYAHYDFFWIDDEYSKYTLHIQDYRGNAGDSMTRHNEIKFSTKDQRNDKWDNPESCAVVFKGAWWYKDCHDSNLNALYLKGKHKSYANGVNWLTFKGRNESLEKTEIKLRPKPKTSF